MASVVALRNKLPRTIHKCLPKSPIPILYHFARRDLRTASSKVSGENVKLTNQKEQMAMKTSQIERKTVTNKSSEKIKGVKEKSPETELGKKTHKMVTADDLREYPFLSLGVSRQLSTRLIDNLGIKTPVEIQSLAIRPISAYRNLVIHSETGSGKTLAYLLPVIQQAKYRCHTIIAVPTRELAYQIYIEARKLAPSKDLACYVSVKDYFV